MTKKSVTVNRKAFHDFHLFDKFTAGMVLCGTEIKSIRKGSVNLKDSFCKIENGEMWLYSCHISPYEQGNQFNHDPLRNRKLLLHKKEITKIGALTKNKGITIVPLRVYLKHGFAKVLIGVGEGKREYDKRETLKRKEQDREMARAVRIKG